MKGFGAADDDDDDKDTMDDADDEDRELLDDEFTPLLFAASSETETGVASAVWRWCGGCGCGGGGGGGSGLGLALLKLLQPPFVTGTAAAACSFKLLNLAPGGISRTTCSLYSLASAMNVDLSSSDKLCHHSPRILVMFLFSKVG